MLDGIRTAINTTMVATPYLGGAIAFLVATTPARDAPMLVRVLGGAATGAIIATAWEYTVNSSDRPEIKAEVILGSAGISGIAGVVGPMIFG